MGVVLIFDVSGGELLVILLFVLLFFGSKGIPDVARTLGRTLRQLRDASNEVQRELTKGTNEVRKGIEEHRRAFLDEVNDPPAPRVPPAPASPTAPPADPPQPGDPA